MNSTAQIRMDAPAHDFLEALPIGNGRLGACIYGEVLREQVVLNESSMWSGSRQNADRDGAYAYLPQIRSLLREGKNYEAQQLFEAHFTCSGKGTNFAHGTDVPFGCYQLVGRLLISYFQAVSSGRQDSCCLENYQRTLDLENAVATVSFELGGKRYTREYMASADEQAIFIHLTCSEPGQIDCTCGLERDECFAVEPLPENTSETSGTRTAAGELLSDGRHTQPGDCGVSEGCGVPESCGAPEGQPAEGCGCKTLKGLYMSGQLADGCGTDRGIHYGCALGVRSRGGKIIQEPLRVRVCGADEAWLVITARTDLSGFMGRTGCDPRQTALADLRTAISTDWETVLAHHRAWYQPQYHSMELTFSDGAAPDSASTPERLQAAAEGRISPDFVALYIQYARYLMICSSQPEGLPANLQGIWSDEILTPWNGDWHLNAQQMIYWLVEKTNLSECHVPFLKLTGELTEPGAQTARTYYNARGWLAHTCTNPWGFTSPCEDASWGSTTGSPAWQCHHLWEHYLYTLDQDYLRWAYPILKGAMLFYIDNMVENEQGYLVTSPSSSPENWFLDDEGRPCALCEGPAYDRALILALTDTCIHAGTILGQDSEFVTELRTLKKRLAPLEIASDGRIMEWSREYPELYPFHRHLSHLWGVYPGSLITMEQTPEYGAAAAKSLRARGVTTAGWALALRGCSHARLRHADEALRCFQHAMKYATARNLMNLAYHCDETLADPPGLDLDRCRYPFQIDGNQGNASTILLMLLDDAVLFREDGTYCVHLYLLPALPALLENGSVRRIRAKGNLSIDMDWSHGQVTSLLVSGPVGSTVILHLNGTVQELTLDEPSVRVL